MISFFIRTVWFLVGGFFLVIWLTIRAILVLMGNLLMSMLVGFLYFCWLSVGSDIKPTFDTMIRIVTSNYQEQYTDAWEKVKIRDKPVLAYNWRELREDQHSVDQLRLF